MKKHFKKLSIAFLIIFILLQMYQPDRTNPTIDPTNALTLDPAMNPYIDSLLRNACYDCHSNETRWPWYCYFSPASLLVSYDVHEGRKHMNLSEWGSLSAGKRMVKLSMMQEEIIEGSMPPFPYNSMHPGANLSKAERDTLLSWIEHY
jgi:hypothetical protein